MKGKLFLSGGGDEIEGKSFNDIYANTVAPNARVLYVPVAWKTANFDECLKWFTSTYSIYGFQIEMLTDLQNCSLEYVMTFDTIYIGGGNTFALLDDVRQSGFDEIILKFLELGKIVFGGSAGAIIFGKDIRTAALGDGADTNDVGINDFTGLDLAGGYVIQCHYDDRQGDELADFANKQNLKILALSNNGGLVIGDGKIDRIEPVREFVPML